MLFIKKYKRRKFSIKYKRKNFESFTRAIKHYHILLKKNTRPKKFS